MKLKTILKYILFFTSLYLVASCTMSISKTCTQSATVVEIGGCGKSSCGVRLSTGYKSDMVNPIIGERVCVSHENHFDFKLIKGL